MFAGYVKVAVRQSEEPPVGCRGRKETLSVLRGSVLCMARPTGFEPAASASAGLRSNPLSYGRVWSFGGRTAEGPGFEPGTEFNPRNRLAGGRTRPTMRSLQAVFSTAFLIIP